MTSVIVVDLENLYRLNAIDKNPYKRLSKLQEENGELADSIIESPFQSTMIEEAVDVFLMLISIAADYATPERFVELLSPEVLEAKFNEGQQLTNGKPVQIGTIKGFANVIYVHYSATLGELATHVQRVAGAESSSYKGESQPDAVFGCAVIAIKRLVKLLGAVSAGADEGYVQGLIDKKMAKWEKVSQ